MKIKRTAINFTLLVLSIIFALFMGEIIVRAFKQRILARVGVHQLFCEYDELLGWKKIPNAQGVHLSDEFAVTEKFNSKGIRGPEYSYEKPADEYRVLVLGDSFAEGHAVGFEELFSEILKRKLNRKSNKYVEVINTGTGGYSTDQELLYFRNEGKKYNPDLTVLMFYYNDVFNNTQPFVERCGYKPFFELENNKLLLKNVPVPKQKTRLLSELSLRGKIKNWFDRNSYLYRFVKIKIKRSPGLYGLLVKMGFIDNPRMNQKAKLPAPSEFKVLRQKYDDQIRYSWELTEALLVELKGEAASIGSELIVFYVPAQSIVYKGRWRDMKKYYEWNDNDWYEYKVGVELGKICELNNIEYIEPTQIFKARAEKLMAVDKRLYFLIDGHWNADGHKLAAEILAEKVQNNIP